MHVAKKKLVKTFQQARQFVRREKICTLFKGDFPDVVSFWDAIDLPEDSGGETKWGARVEAVWAWKNALPEKYPDEIFYGKIKGGHAALMSIDYLRDTHFTAAHKPVMQCTPIAQHVFQLIRTAPGTTAELRKQTIADLGCSKSQFDTALKQLQITLNIARLNTPSTTSDTWVPFSEMYLDIVEMHAAS